MTCQAELSPCPWKGRWSLPPATLETLAPSVLLGALFSPAPTAPSPCCLLEQWIQKSFQRAEEH